MRVDTYECIECGARYPLMAPGLYPARAPHGPGKDCRAPQGWRRLPAPDEEE